MGPDEILPGVRMGFMKHFDTKNDFFYERLEATVLDSNTKQHSEYGEDSE